MPTKTKKVAPKKKAIKKVVAKKEPDAKPIQKIIYRFEKRFAFIPSCTNCEHVPMRINRLVALMTILVTVLSGIVIAQSRPMQVDRIIANAISAVAQK